jgi:hypothetical protein
MRTIHLLLFACLLFVPRGAWAQGVQNMDCYWLFGSQSVKSQTIPGTAVTLPGATGLTTNFGYGYQIVRKSAASLWVEAFFVIGGDAQSIAPGIAGTFNSGWSAFPSFLPGFRFMVPLQSRISVYAAGGGGVSNFSVPQIEQQPFPTASSSVTYHGVFDFGGGVDVRLNRLLSIRGEVRDFVTGTGLGGVTGRNHRLVSGGMALHF